MKERCEICKYFEEGNGEKGICRLYAETAIADPIDWCGDYEKNTNV